MSERDNRLISEYDARRADDAFAALVRQHINLVFATAMRQVGDHGAAEEITQNVFIALARASGKLKSHPTIAGWLYRTTLNKSREWLRSELRRHQREQVAVSRELARSEGDSIWSPLAPLLDEALMGLRESDRMAVIMHFMEGQTFHQVGSALGIGEDSARKRVDRCLEQLTHFFHRHGFAVPSITAGAPLFALSTHVAPAGLAASVTSTGLAAAHSAASTSTLTLVKGALKIMAWTNAKTTVAVGIGLLVAAGTTTVAVKGIEALQAPAWQKDRNISFVNRLPSQVRILPSLPSTLQSGDLWGGSKKGVIGWDQSVRALIRIAYQVSENQIIWNAPIAGTRYTWGARYDFIANLPAGSDDFKAMQEQIKKKLGLTGRFELIDTNVLILTVQSRHATGLHPGTRPVSYYAGQNSFSSHGQTLYAMVNSLEAQYLGIVIFDKTQLHGNYDVDLNWDGTTQGLKQALLDQAGLELVPTNMTVQMLVVEPVN